MKQVIFLIITFLIVVFLISPAGDLNNKIIKAEEFTLLHSEVNPIFYFAIVTALVGIGFTLFYRRLNHNSTHELEDLKHNITLLRDEKLGSYLNLKLQNKRRKILNNAEHRNEDLNLLYTQKAKKLGVSTGDFLLASKIHMINKKGLERSIE